MHLNYTTLAILSAVFAAIANILARTILKELKSKEILSINFLTMGLTLLVLSPLFYSFHATRLALELVGLVGLIDTIANYFYFKAFEAVEASVATPVLSLAPGFTFVFGWLFLSETVSAKTLLLTLAIIVLIVLFSVDFKRFKHTRATLLVPAVCSSLLFGVSAIPSKYLLSHDLINAPTLYLFRAFIIAAFGFVLFRKHVKHLKTQQYRNIFIRGLFVITQWLLLYYALSRNGSAGVAVTLGNITPIFVFVLSVIFLREKPVFKKFAAATLVLVLSLLV